ncbi:uncharacterized protein MKK02DRAFT_44379 [Dioszegia hungarica]|uniref:Uncharacterized protein n=1 Tax=Dioszegia hungarica TaxID=4972 RepID=A0AA38HAM7_9TREE|nr:uncharacterized protein MKK02DRAFT_44379 [Dioszegia hungarica]KAI9635681.1 hypothetical protein MKK02DRAFT_44379 [Dioszegia hungarica]
MSIPDPFPAPAEHQPSSRPSDVHGGPKDDIMAEEGGGESGKGSDQGDEEDETEVEEREKEEDAAPRRPSQVSPYLSADRPLPRIKLRVGGDGAPPSASIQQDTDRPTSSHSSGPPHLNGQLRQSEERCPPQNSPTPPGSPLRSFIAPAAAAAPSGPPAQPARPAHQPAAPSSRPSSSHAIALPLPHASTGARRGSSPVGQTSGTFWKTTTSAAPAPVPVAEERGEDEDVDMEEEDDEEMEDGEDELDSDYFEEGGEEREDDDMTHPTSPVNITSRGSVSAPSAPTSAPTLSPAAGAGDEGGAKRKVRGKGKKQKEAAKAKELEREKAAREENAKKVIEGAVAVEEVTGKDGKGDFAYEYVAVSQRKEGRQHL